VKGSQVVADAVHTYGDTTKKCNTAQGAGARQPGGGRCCAHIQTQAWRTGGKSAALRLYDEVWGVGEAWP